jgi:hypothetical protein
MSNPEAEQLAADIARQRDDLADTVDALQHKLDVKSHARHKADELRDRPELIAAGVAVAVVVIGLIVLRRRH